MEENVETMEETMETMTPQVYAEEPQGFLAKIKAHKVPIIIGAAVAGLTAIGAVAGKALLGGNGEQPIDVPFEIPGGEEA